MRVGHRTAMNLAILFLTIATCPQNAGDQFHPPIRMQAGGVDINIEAPGYAAPCWHDLDSDGYQDLIVGQYADGKMLVCKGCEDGSLQKGEWLQAEGDIAKVPGMW
jgi:hypothetical protein